MILCIEDEADLREDLVDELQESGYRVLAAPDAYRALEMLKTVQPHLILCDITMPGLDGYGFLDIVRNTFPQLATTPFVFLTAQATPQQVIKGKQAGADDYLLKPVDFDLMLATIATRLQQVARMHERYTQDALKVQQMVGYLHEQRTQASFLHVAQAFDYVAAGIVLLDASLNVCFANKVAAQMLSATYAPRVGERFTLGMGGASSCFHKAFNDAVIASQSDDDAVGSVVLPRPDGEHDLLLMVCPLASRHVLHASDPVVMVMVCDPQQRKRLSPEALGNVFGLTPTEALIACAFAEGKRSDAIATQFGVSATTVAFHKRNLFQKTNTNRQADLIALLLTLSVIDA